MHVVVSDEENVVGGGENETTGFLGFCSGAPIAQAGTFETELPQLTATRPLSGLADPVATQPQDSRPKCPPALGWPDTSRYIVGMHPRISAKTTLSSEMATRPTANAKGA